MIILWKGETAQEVPRERASWILSAAAGIEGWFYPSHPIMHELSVRRSELVYLSSLPGSSLDVKREWSKLFTFKWIG